jgi:cytochrome c-type biogenesis protein
MHPHTHQVLPSIAFTLGLASSLSALGLAAAFLGQVYGAEAGGTLPTILALASSGLFVAMGLALLEILPLPQLLPSSAARLDQVLACIKVRARQRETGKAEKGRLTPITLAPTHQGEAPNPLKGLGLAYVFGASTALVASPCATPVLASLLAFITTSGADPLVGAALLVAVFLYPSPIPYPIPLCVRACVYVRVCL